MSKSIATNDTKSCSRAWSILVLGLIQASVLSISGCRTTSDNQIDLLERELRVQEDYIYELEGYVVDYSEKLRDCRGCSPSQMATYSEEVYQPASAPKTKAQPKRRRAAKEKSILDEAEEGLPSPDSDSPVQDFDPDQLEVPDIDMQLDDPITEIDSNPDVQQLVAVELDYESADGQIMLIPDPVDFNETADEFALEELADEQFDAEPVEQATALVERKVERLDVKQLFRSEGDHQSLLNLLTVVEALDENDEPVDLDGEVSLMVMSPDETGKPQRIKRWNFTPEETVSAWQSSDLGDGLHLELPLEETELPNTPLELWVRLVTKDGRKLLSQLPFKSGELIAMDEADTPTAPTELANTEQTQSSVNPLRMQTLSTPTADTIKLVDRKATATDSGWRSSMHRTDRTAAGFATTSAKATGWSKQTPSNLQYQATNTTKLPSSTVNRSPTQTASKPSWTSGIGQ